MGTREAQWILSILHPWKAIAQLDVGLQESQANPESELLRDKVIQRFEYTYELSWKMLKRYQEATLPSPEEVDDMTFQTLIRTGSEQGLLLSGRDRWADYRKARGTTSHIYDEKRLVKFLRSCRLFWRKHDSYWKGLVIR